MEKKFEDLKVSVPTLASKQPAGKRGIEFEGRVNVVPLTLTPNIPFFKYDCRMYVKYVKSTGEEVRKELTKQTRDDFTEQERKRATVQIYKKLIKENGSFFGDNSSLFYDRAAVLLSLKKFPIDGEAKTFTLPKDYIAGFDDSAGFIVEIKIVTENFQCNTNDLKKAVGARAGEIDRTLVEALNLVVGQVPLMDQRDFITYGNGTHYLYSPDPKVFGNVPDLPDGKYLGIGANKAVKVLEGVKGAGEAFVVVEVKKTAFHGDGQPLLDKLRMLSVNYGRDGFCAKSVHRNIEAIRPLLKNLTVRTNHSKNSQVFPIRSIATFDALNKKVELNGKPVSIAQYFLEKYNLRLKYPDFPLVVGRFKNNELCFPMEVLEVAPDQRVIGQQQTPAQISAMGISNPVDRCRETIAMTKVMQISNSPFMKAAGISARDDFINLKGRVLPTLSVQNGDRRVTKVDNNCQWRNSGRFVDAKPLSQWMVVANLDGRDAEQIGLVKQYLKSLVDVGRAKGMNISIPEIRTCNRPDARSITVLTKLYDSLTYAKEKKMQLVMMITSDRVALHGWIKEQEAVLQVLTQEIKLSKAITTVTKRQNQTLENVLMKMNQKLGGLNNVILMDDKTIRYWISDPKKLIIGFEFSHPAPLSKWEIERGETYNTPSVVGFGANTSVNPQYFLGDFKYIPAHQPELLEAELKNIIMGLIEQMQSNRKQEANHLIIYFNGISEGQYNLVAGKYLEIVRAACKTPKPKITLIAAMKVHNERFYKKNIVGKNASEQNIPPGVVFDKVIVNPKITEFYLNAHNAFKGTAKTPKYAVLVDDANMSQDEVQGNTHALCHMHDIVNATVSVPQPLIVADRSAKRGTSNVAQWKGDKDVIDIKEANQRLTYRNKPLANQRFHA